MVIKLKKRFFAFAGQRLVSVACAVALLAGLFTFLPGKTASGAAQIWEGDGNAASPFLIGEAFQLDAARQYSAAVFKLTADVDLSGYPGFSPIGTEDEPFTGVFDGAGYSVYNCEISGAEAAGLFGYIKNGTVKNLTIKDSFISGTKFAGAIAGRAENSAIINCRNINTAVTAANSAAAGGIAGELSGRGEYLSVAGIVTAGENSAAGGIAGRISEAALENCYNTGSVSAASGKAGGLAAEAEGTAFSCYNSGSVSAGSGIAGGIFATSNGTVSACYNTGKIISLTTAAGGLLGIAKTGARVNYSYNAGSISPNPSGLYGAVAGINEGAAFTAVYYLNSAEYQIGNGGTANNIKWLTTKNMYSADVLSDYMSDVNPYPASPYFQKPERAAEGCGTEYFPELAVFAEGRHSHDFLQENIKAYDNRNSAESAMYSSCASAENEAPFTAGNGTAARPYEIRNAAELSHIRAHSGDNFILTRNIDLSGIKYEGDTAEVFGWKPIGTKNEPFTGSLDGNGYIITGLKLCRPNDEYTGLFGYINGGAVKNLGLYGGRVTAGEGAAAGALAGAVDDEGIISGCFSTAEIICASSRTAGGLAGELISGKIEGSFTKSAISGSVNYAGGIAGINGGIISLSYAIPSSSEPNCESYGGIVGNNDGNIDRIYSTCTPKEHAALFGAVAGENTGVISNAYCLTGVSGTGSGADGVISVDISEFALPSGISPALSGINNNPAAPDFINDGESGSGCQTKRLPVLSCLSEVSWIFSKISREAAVYSRCEAGENEAAFENGNGTPADPYQISSPGHLAHIKQHLDSSFILTADLDLQGISYSSAPSFTGIFDGGGHRITGLTAPLFDLIKMNGQVKGLQLDEVQIYSDKEYTGAVARINNGNISNCIINGALSGPSNIGGIAGKNTGIVTGCLFSGSISAQSDCAGGIAALNEGIIQTCFAAGAITGDENATLGGISGENTGELATSLNTAQISAASAYKGALAGASDGIIYHSYYTTECGAAGVGTALSAGELTNAGILANLSGFAAAGWQKRPAEADFVFYPEISGLAEFAAASKAAASVSRRELTQITPIPAEITYGQPLSDAVTDGMRLYLQINVPGSFTWNIENPSAVIPENGDKFDILFTPSEDLYKPAILRNIAVTVNPAEPDLPTPGVIIYNPEQSLRDIPLEQGWSWDKPETVPQVNNQGYSASYTPPNSNYKPKSGVILSVTIQPATAKKPLLAALEYDSGRRLSDIALPEGWSWDNPEITPEANKSQYPASFSDPAGNYADEAGIMLTLIITPARPELPQVEAVTFREGLTLRDIALPEGWLWDAPDTVINVNNSGFTASFNAENNPNIIGLSAEIIIFDVIPAVPQAPEIEAVTFQAGKTLKDIALPEGWSFRDSVLCPTVKNNGYILIYTPDDRGNYSYKEITIPLTVLPTSFVGEAPAIYTVSYVSGMRLGDLNLPEGWRWENPDLLLTVGNKGYKALYNDPDGNYLPADFEVYVKVGNFSIKNIKAKYTMRPGDLIELAPEPDGGEWDYDEVFLRGEFGQSTIFTALAPGNTEIKYSVGGKEFKSEVVILAAAGDSGLGADGAAEENPTQNPGTGRGGIPAALLMMTCVMAMILMRKRERGSI